MQRMKEEHFVQFLTQAPKGAPPPPPQLTQYLSTPVRFLIIGTHAMEQIFKTP